MTYWARQQQTQRQAWQTIATQHRGWLRILSQHYQQPSALLRKGLTPADLAVEIGGVIARHARAEAESCVATNQRPPDGDSIVDRSVRAVYARLMAAELARQEADERALFEQLKAEQDAI